MSWGCDLWDRAEREAWGGKHARPGAGAPGRGLVVYSSPFSFSFSLSFSFAPAGGCFLPPTPKAFAYR